MPELIDKKIQF